MIKEIKATTTKTFKIFLIVVLVAGTFAAISPWFIMGEVQAQTAVPSTPCKVTVDTITGVGSSIDMAYDPVNERMYVTNINNDTVSVIDTTTNTVVGSPIPVGDFPYGIAYDPVNKRMYVTNLGDASRYLLTFFGSTVPTNVGNDTVSVIDTTSNTVIGNPIPVGKSPASIEYDPVNERMYVVNPWGASVSVIDTTTNNVTDTIPAEDMPGAIAYDPVNKKMYMTKTIRGTVSVIETSSNIVNDTIPVRSSPLDMEYDPVNKRMYGVGNDTVSVIDTTSNTVVGNPIQVGDDPRGIAYDPVNERMYVTNVGDDTVSVIDTTSNTVIDTIPAGNGPYGIAYDPVNKRMYVTNPEDSTISVINLC